MTPTEEKLKKLQDQIEFCVKEEANLRKIPSFPPWAGVKAEFLKDIRESLTEYRRKISMQGIATGG